MQNFEKIRQVSAPLERLSRKIVVTSRVATQTFAPDIKNRYLVFPINLMLVGTKASRPIQINTSNLNGNVSKSSRNNPYPSPVSPTTLSFSPSKFLSSYQLPYSFTSRYLLHEELGYGGFGFVYSIIRIADSARFACKFIFKSKVSRNCWTIDRELGQCPMEVAVLKNVTCYFR